MKSWFAQHHVSSSVDRALAGGPAKPQVPPSLHDSIMRAVEAAGPASAPVRPQAGLRWLLVPVLAVLLLAGVWSFLHRPSRPQPMARAAAALEIGEAMADTVPSVVVAPLSDEWQRINRDLDRTAQFLLASLP